MTPEDWKVARHLHRAGREALEDTPILVLQGARQVGKSTLARDLVAESGTYVNLDDEQARAFAAEDATGFVRQAGDGILVIDEAQRSPHLILALKSEVDRDRRPGRFILTGSVDLLGARGVGDSLAGRAETLRVHPLSPGEIHQRPTPEDFITWIVMGAPGDVEPAPKLAHTVVAGGFPEPLKRTSRTRRDRWYASYVERLARHDAAEITTGAFADNLIRLLRIVAARGQSELVKAKLARELNVSEGTVTNYLDLCRRLYLMDALPSWGSGYSGRETRRPKLALGDTGLAAHLTGFAPEAARSVGGHEYFGTLVEQFVAAELRKQQGWTSTPYQLFHYRHREAGVDIVVELRDGSLVLIEVKSALSVGRDAWRPMQQLKDRLSDRVRARIVLYAGDQTQRMRDQQYLLPLSALWAHPA